MDELKYETKLQVLLLIKRNNIPEATLVVHLELNCGLREAKEIVENLKPGTKSLTKIREEL